MKVLLVNKFFYPKGGAENSFFETARLLERKGHKVVVFSMSHPQNIDSPYSPYFVSQVDMGGGGALEQIRTAGRIQYSFEAKRKIERLIEAEKPDIAHLNNIYHQISPSIIDALKKRGIPMVMSLRDYKLTCPVYTLMRCGKICEECAHGNFYRVLVNRCTKGSFLKSAVNMTEMYLHHRLLHIYEKIDEFISPSRFLRDKTLEMGFKGSINYLPNFVVPGEFEPSFGSLENTIVCAGRLSEEKGVATLIDAVRGLDGVWLKIIGDGPLMGQLKAETEAWNAENVIFTGFKNGPELKEEVRRAAFTVIPSEWYENNPRSVLEAFALGKPVIGARIGGIPELVKDNETGLLFTPGNSEDLRNKIRALLEKKPAIISLGKNARRFVEEEFEPEKHYRGLIRIYEKALSKSAKRIAPG